MSETDGTNSTHPIQKPRLAAALGITAGVFALGLGFMFAGYTVVGWMIALVSTIVTVSLYGRSILSVFKRDSSSEARIAAALVLIQLLAPPYIAIVHPVAKDTPAEDIRMAAEGPVLLVETPFLQTRSDGSVHLEVPIVNTGRRTATNAVYLIDGLSLTGDASNAEIRSFVKSYEDRIVTAARASDAQDLSLAEWEGGQRLYLSPPHALLPASIGPFNEGKIKMLTVIVASYRDANGPDPKTRYFAESVGIVNPDGGVQPVPGLNYSKRYSFAP